MAALVATTVARRFRRHWFLFTLWFAIVFICLPYGYSYLLGRVFRAGLLFDNQYLMMALNLLSAVINPFFLTILMTVALVGNQPMFQLGREDMKTTLIRQDDLLRGLFWFVLLVVFFIESLLLLVESRHNHPEYWLSFYSFLSEWAYERNWKPLWAYRPGIHIPRFIWDYPYDLAASAIRCSVIVIIALRFLLPNGVGAKSLLCVTAAYLGYTLLITLNADLWWWILFRLGLTDYHVRPFISAITYQFLSTGSFVIVSWVIGQTLWIQTVRNLEASEENAP